MAVPYNCRLFGRLMALCAAAYSADGTTIKRYSLHIRDSQGKLIFTYGFCEYYADDRAYIKKWSNNYILSHFGEKDIFVPTYAGGTYNYYHLDEKVLNNAYIEIRWFSVLEIKEYYAKIPITQSDIALLKELALNDGFDYYSILNGEEAHPIVMKEVNFVVRLSLGGVGFINVNRDNGDEYFLKRIMGVAQKEPQKLSRVQKITKLKEDPEYAKYFIEKYQDEDFVKTFDEARAKAKEVNNDVNICFIANNYTPIINSIKMCTNIYKYKISIDGRYRVAYIKVCTTAQEKYNLVGKQIKETTLIAAPIRSIFAVMEMPYDYNKKKWVEMKFVILDKKITMYSSTNKKEQEYLNNYFKNLNELSGRSSLINDEIIVNNDGEHSIIDRKIYEQLPLVTYSLLLDFENNKLLASLYNHNTKLSCPMLVASYEEDFVHDIDKPFDEENNNLPIFPKGTEID